MLDKQALEARITSNPKQCGGRPCMRGMRRRECLRATRLEPEGRCGDVRDSGAFTQHVYEFVRRTKDPNIIPVKGATGMTQDQVDNDRRALAKRTAKRMRTGKPPEILGVNSIKRTIYAYPAADRGRPGHCHFPRGRSDEHYDQLTGERLVTAQGARETP